MADLTYVITSRSIVGGKTFVKATANFEAVGSYPEGGQPVDPAALGLYAIDFCLVMGNPSVTYNDTLRTLQIFGSALTDGTVAADEVTDLGVTSAERAPGPDPDPSGTKAILFIIGY